jgi:hypothetical protein
MIVRHHVEPKSSLASPSFWPSVAAASAQLRRDRSAPAAAATARTRPRAAGRTVARAARAGRHGRDLS